MPEQGRRVIAAPTGLQGEDGTCACRGAEGVRGKPLPYGIPRRQRAVHNHLKIFRLEDGWLIASPAGSGGLANPAHPCDISANKHNARKDFAQRWRILPGYPF